MKTSKIGPLCFGWIKHGLIPLRFAGQCHVSVFALAKMWLSEDSAQNPKTQGIFREWSTG